jgi:hydrogenase nickel incorporation protein HypA/HybF
MHESSLVPGLVSAGVAAVESAGATSARRVVIRVGALSPMSPEHIAEHLPAAMEGSVLEGATVVVAVSRDYRDVNALDVVLESVEIEEAEA